MNPYSDIYFGRLLGTFGSEIFLHHNKSYGKLFINKYNCNVKITTKYVCNTFLSSLKPKYNTRDYLKMKKKPFATVEVVSIRHIDDEANVVPCYYVKLVESEKGVKYHKYNLKPKYKYRWVKESDLT